MLAWEPLMPNVAVLDFFSIRTQQLLAMIALKTLVMIYEGLDTHIRGNMKDNNVCCIIRGLNTLREDKRDV